MSFKIAPPFKQNPTPVVNMPLGDEIMGRADKRGTILINQNMTNPQDILDTYNHEEVHINQMASGDLDYDNNNVYWKGKKYPRGSFDETNKKLAWEIPAYKAG
jgi:hypothetical protein|tara:strand:+ start:202 stop:510 length:309 start_codon:yes stop_codon:yes gene_type:complete